MSLVAPCLALVLALSPGDAPVVAVSTADMAEFDAAVAAGQTFFDAGEYLSAARTWTVVARKLPPTPEQRGNLVAVHTHVADAYDRATARDADPALVREALGILDEQDARLTAAYPDDPRPPRVAAVRERLQGRLDAGAAAVAPLEPIDVTWTERPVVRPWRPMLLGGSVALAGGVAMSVVLAVGLVRAKHYENGLQGAALGCQVEGSDDACGDYYGAYRTASAMTATGLILAPALLGTGAALLIVAARRKRAAQPGFTPVFARGLYGLAWERRF